MYDKMFLLSLPQMENLESERIDNAELKVFIQAHVPAARLKEALGNDLVYTLPPFTSSNASSYRSLLTALDSNLDALQLGGYGISDTTLEEVNSYTSTHKMFPLQTLGNRRFHCVVLITMINHIEAESQAVKLFQ